MRNAQAVVFGPGRYRGRLFGQLRAEGIDVIGVDFHPEAVREPQGRGLPALFRDGEDSDFLETLPLKPVGWVNTTFPQWGFNRALLHALKAVRYRGWIAGAARDSHHGFALAEAGVERVIHLFDDAADHAAAGLARDIRQQETPPCPC